MPTGLKTGPNLRPDKAAGQSPAILERPHTIVELIETAFNGDEAGSQPLHFEWRLIRRNQWPFLLLPANRRSGEGLRLYSAQRRRAKIARALLPLLFNTPAAVLFQRFSFQTTTGAEFIRFLAQQSGVPVAQFSAPAIKFGGAENKSRLVLLLCDESNRPVSVIKMGLDPAGRAATDREAALLAHLPPDKIGCIRMTGRFTTPAISAFATAYYPGESPEDDTGLEHLFHAWLNPGPTVPVESLETWAELEAAVSLADPDNWQIVRERLAGRSIRTTLYHGDFAPWNVRSINTKNLQAFDWERGCLRGIPGWDWFHFVVQTAILVRRHSVERVAAEMEQVLNSDRFKNYAAAAGISELVKPLFLAALLNQKWVVKPVEGGRVTYELFKLLAVRWQLNPRPHLNGHYIMEPAVAPRPGLRADAGLQLKFATSRLRNLFWEPTLNSPAHPPLARQFRAHWRMISLISLLLAGVALIHFQATPHLLLLPFYLTPCALATWKVDRRWGAIFATLAAAAGTLVQLLRGADLQPLDVVLWNLGMRLLLFLMTVSLLGRVLQQRKLAMAGDRPNVHSHKAADNWAVLVTSGLWLGAVIVLQIYSSRHLNFIPLYLIPCAALTLTMGRRWGMAAATLAAVAGPMIQRFGDPDYEVASVEFWNIIMLCVFLQAVVLMLDELLRQNILFFPGAPRSQASRTLMTEAVATPPGNAR